jgi:hypothetical protein
LYTSSTAFHPALLPSWKDCLNSVEQCIFVSFTVIQSTTAIRVSLPISIVGRKGMPISLTLTLFKLMWGLGTNILLFQMRAVVVFDAVLGISKGSVLVIIV